MLTSTPTRQDKTRQDKTRQDKTRQDKTRQDKTRQDKTRQDKTTIVTSDKIIIMSLWPYLVNTKQTNDQTSQLAAAVRSPSHPRK